MVTYNDPEIRSKFASGAKQQCKRDLTLTDEQWEIKGLLSLKRKTLGLCGRRSDKSINELAEILKEFKVVDSLRGGRSLVSELYGDNHKFDYGGGYISFSRVLNADREVQCRIEWDGYESGSGFK
jgi:hypothetical protein